MNIVMFTNTYAPIVGGVERSIEVFMNDFAAMGHRTLVVTLKFERDDESTAHVFRLPSIKHVSGSPFAIRLPADAGLNEVLDRFQPDIVHAHQPFMLGDSALRISRRRNLPLVFTNHTMWERYLDKWNFQSDTVERIAVQWPIGYANLCDVVVAPTDSIAELLRQRGVTRPIEVVPTGLDTTHYEGRDGQAARRTLGLPPDAPVLGHVGRLVAAKNLRYAAHAVARAMRHATEAWFLLVGEGAERDAVLRILEEAGVSDRVVAPGLLRGDAVADAYAAMDLFVFTSHTDTQGIVLVEAMASGAPIVALRTPGPRDVIRDGMDGVLLEADATADDFAAAVTTLLRDPARMETMARQARERATNFDHRVCAERMLAVYQRTQRQLTTDDQVGQWDRVMDRIGVEWSLLEGKAATLGRALLHLE